VGFFDLPSFLLEENALNIHLSTLSALTPRQFVLGLATARWPSYVQLSRQARSLGASSLQLVILNGWKEEELLDPSIPAIEGPWEVDPGDLGFLGRQIFGKNGVEMTKRVVSRKRELGHRFVTVDCSYADNRTCLVEIAGLPGRYSFIEGIKQGVHTHPICYDTWHARETVPMYNRHTWMLPHTHFLRGRDVPENLRYYESEPYRMKVNKELKEQFDLVKHAIGLIQVHTRSTEEAKRFIEHAPTMLGFQMPLLWEWFPRSPALQGRGSASVVVECPPWWRMSFRKKFIESVELALSDFPE
jgi:hypothetical protein